MSDQSRKKVEPTEVQLFAAQIAFIDHDAERRYPDAYAKKRGRSPALRDGIAFWMAHYDIFLTWITTRG